MAVGDIIQEFGFRKRTITLASETGCTKGDVLAWNTDGYAPATAASIGPFFVALQTVTAPTSGQATVEALEEGVVEVAKVTGAINDGAWVAPSSTAGKVTAWAPPDAPSSYGESTMQAELDKIFKRVGRAYGSAGTNAATVKIRLLSV